MKNQLKKQNILFNINHLNLNTVSGRPLFRDLNLSMSYEQVALLGRNGAGKTTLIEVIAQLKQSSSGQINCYTRPFLVRQKLEDINCDITNAEYLADLFSGLNIFKLDIESEFSSIGLRSYQEILSDQGFSNGELRKLNLLNAKFRHPDLLLLDEPTEDLDECGFRWLYHWLKQWNNGLILVSHNQRILQIFSHFFIVRGSGCQYFNCTFKQLEYVLDREDTDRQKKYIHKINDLIEKEEHNRRVNCRRQQKKNQGRIRELNRMTPKSRLNSKRSYAQESQGRVAKIREERISSARNLVKISRKELTVTLPMELLLPTLPPADGKYIFNLHNISKIIGERTLFSNIVLKIKRERIAILGSNGAGKSTLLKIILKQLQPTSGTILTRLEKVGCISQGASNWMLEDNLIAHMMLISNDLTPDKILKLLIGFKFPLALAERSLRSLSPGERARAALICLLTRKPTIEFLVLDEPAYSMDFIAIKALQSTLKSWTGGLVIAGHDRQFFENIGIDRYIELDGKGGHTIT